VREWSYARQVDETRFHATRSATIHVGKKAVGTIGQVSGSVARAFGVEVCVVLVQLQFQAMLDVCTTISSYTPIAVFPEVKRDLAFVVSERTEYGAIVERMKKNSTLLQDVELFDTYRKGLEEGKKSVAVHLSFRHEGRTLEAQEVDSELDAIRGVLQKDFGAIMRS
jgi:phenylalanyl-tRNA synthetase beta chain